MVSLRSKFLPFAGFLFLTSYASAATIYTTTLLPGNESPPNPASKASGSATLTLNGNMLSVDVIFTGLTVPASAAHIHCCGAPGTNFAVAIPFTGFPAATSGEYKQTFDLTLTATYTSAFLGTGTAASAEAAIIAALNAGQTYVNIHNSTYPGGEIRGFPAAAAATPEPSTLLLGGSLLAGFLVMRRRK